MNEPYFDDYSLDPGCFPAEAPVVCLCGSGRFLKQMIRLEEILTLKFLIVLKIGVNTKDIARHQDMNYLKPMLDELHKRKIDICDYVYIVNVDGYIGESTSKEIEYAKSKNKVIYYLFPI